MNEDKGGKAIIVVGGTGCGKSFFNKKMVVEVHPDARYIFDPQREYGEFYPTEKYVKREQFIKGATNMTDKFIVYEEASMIFSNRGYNDEVVEQLVCKRHTRNTFVLVFHSLRAVPKYILDYCNYLVLFKTNDPDDLVESFKHTQLLEAFKNIKNAEWKYNGGKKYSPHEIITLLG